MRTKNLHVGFKYMSFKSHVQETLEFEYTKTHKHFTRQRTSGRVCTKLVVRSDLPNNARVDLMYSSCNPTRVPCYQSLPQQHLTVTSHYGTPIISSYTVLVRAKRTHLKLTNRYLCENGSTQL